MPERVGINDRCIKEYQKRINMVLDYIDNNFDMKLSVEILAEVACFSAYHFHRVFHSIAGETINGYIKKIRHSRAAYRLLYSPELTVTEIALECGFSSLSDFSRSFKAFYGTTPSKFSQARKNRGSCINDLHVNARPELFSHKIAVDEESIKNIKRTLLPDLNIAYIRCSGLSKKLENARIENAYKKLFRWGLPRAIINKETLVLGVTLDSPEVVPMNECRYDACITVPHDTQPEGEIGIRLLKSEGTYVMFTIIRNREDANTVFFNMADYIYGYWLPDNGYLPDDKPFIEFYRQDADTGNILTDFHIPIKPF